MKKLLSNPMTEMMVIFLSVIVGFSSMFLGQWFLIKWDINPLLIITSFVITIPLGIRFMAYMAEKTMLS